MREACKAHASILILSLVLVAACGGDGGEDDQAGAAAGTYEGMIDRADTTTREVVVVLDDGRRLDLVLTDGTALQESGNPVDLTALQSGTRVRVTVEREGEFTLPTRIQLLP